MLVSKKPNKFFFSIIILSLIQTTLSIKEWWEETKVPILNETNFYDIIGHEKYVVVKFFTKWCIYCKYMSPEYEKFFEQNKIFSNALRSEISSTRCFS